MNSISVKNKKETPKEFKVGDLFQYKHKTTSSIYILCHDGDGNYQMTNISNGNTYAGSSSTISGVICDLTFLGRDCKITIEVN